jgi:DNA processing protein
MSTLQGASITVVTIADPEYPSLLREIHNPPAVLYLKGKLQHDATPTVAIVGSRRATHYGKTVADKLALALADAGIIVVSGLARGIDTTAHQGALKAGNTYAVLGSGLDIIYPNENVKLAQAISEQGALISEYPLGTPPDARHFPARNRIISGLSLGTVVIEAQETSGSLITADFALEQNREVFAVPGSIMAPTSRGCHRLLKQGAKLVENVEDILEEIGLHRHSVTPSADLQLTLTDAVGLSDTQKEIIEHLGFEPRHLDELVRETGRSLGVILSQLIQLELSGLIKALPGRYYVRCQ